MIARDGDAEQGVTAAFSRLSEALAGSHPPPGVQEGIITLLNSAATLLREYQVDALAPPTLLSPADDTRDVDGEVID
jgi:hypothetical protein